MIEDFAKRRKVEKLFVHSKSDNSIFKDAKAFKSKMKKRTYVLFVDLSAAVLIMSRGVGCSEQSKTDFQKILIQPY